MFADNDRDARAAFQRWQGQGPSGPYNGDLLEALTFAEGELMEHLASFMFRAGVEFQKHCGAVDVDLEAALKAAAKHVMTSDETAAQRESWTRQDKD